MGALVAWCREALRPVLDASPREAEWLVAAALARWERSFGHEQEPVSGAEWQRVREWVSRRRAGEPLALIEGRQDFLGRSFQVDRRVLIPRPETEGLVEAVLRAEPAGPIVDVGTGSGAIAISLALERGETSLAVDRSLDALRLARDNARRLGAPVRWCCSDLLGALRGPFGAVVANLPYVTRFEYARLPPSVLRHEPAMALEPPGESVGAMRRRLVEQAARRLRPRGLLALEVGAGQSGQARDDLRRAGFEEVRVIPDLAGIGRVVTGRWGRAPASA